MTIVGISAHAGDTLCKVAAPRDQSIFDVEHIPATPTYLGS